MEYRLELADVARKYPRGGGQPPKGMKLLKQGKDWTAESADPDKVSKLLLAAQFDGMKAVVLCFIAIHHLLLVYWQSLLQQDGILLRCSARTAEKETERVGLSDGETPHFVCQLLGC